MSVSNVALNKQEYRMAYKPVLALYDTSRVDNYQATVDRTRIVKRFLVPLMSDEEIRVNGPAAFAER